MENECNYITSYLPCLKIAFLLVSYRNILIARMELSDSCNDMRCELEKKMRKRRNERYTSERVVELHAISRQQLLVLLLRNPALYPFDCLENFRVRCKAHFLLQHCGWNANVQDPTTNQRENED